MSYSPASTSSASSSSSRVHPASLVDVSLHSSSILELVETKVSRQVIDYVVEQTAETVDFAMGRPHARGRSPTKQLQSFSSFVNTVITRAEVTMPTILTTLAYIDRARPHISIALEEWAHERVFLGALMVASKYTNDSTLKNVHWALCTGVFGKRDVGRIEREFLEVLNFELSVSEADIMAHHEAITSLNSHHVHHHHHHHHVHHHHRHHHHERLPEAMEVDIDEMEVDSSSSSSSSASCSPSPQTPSTLVESPPPAKSHHRNAALDLLRSIHIPTFPQRAHTVSHQPASIRI
ncbi:hypothetical protein BD626DRAFT_409246 [Schizophyllum amplum]|uniref:Cyclin N-terminal domain-containing protein n=1 Tax=Schizophyllum amplum TaxID=97359 RepID=A0A550C302_9AGAR|nr:hypothetical protein BD626DRAFT_409246 [Auriculariopsis ampla]